MGEYETVYADFVVEKLRSAGGSLKFQHLTGHLSQLNEETRRRIGTKPSEIMKFLRGRSDLFNVEQNGMISLQSSSSYEDGSEKSSKSIDSYLHGEEGTVIKVLPAYGFIYSKQHKFQVYFSLSSLEDATEGQILTNILDPGKKVCFNARKVNRNGESKYQATKVWFPKKAENEVLRPEGFSKLRKSRDTGLFDPPKIEGTGKIQKVFENFGFIIIDDDPNNTVFFSKKEVRQVENVTNLTKIFKVKDIVDFKAIRSVKKDAKTRWQATQVFVKGQSKPTQSKKLEKDVPGKIYPGSKGIVIKFGPSFENIADADSCIFYLHGTKVEDVSWEFSDGDAVKLDVVSIKSSPYWKALLCWVGQRPNIVLKEDLGDFSGHDEFDDMTESGSYTSKTSSEKSYNSEASKHTKLSSYSEAPSFNEKPSKQRHHRDNKRSDFRGSPSRSLSRSSRSSLHSQASSKKFQPIKPGYKNQNLHQKFEKDLNYGSSQKMNKKPKKKSSPFPQEYSDDNCTEEYKPCDTSHKLKDSKIKKEPETYTSWGDTPYPGEEEIDSDDSLDAPEDTQISNPSIHLKSPSGFRKASPLNDDSEEKYESNNEFSSDEVISNVQLNESEGESSEDDSDSGVLPMDEEVESMFKNINKDDNDSAKSDKKAIQPYIRRFKDINGKVRRVFCKCAEIENPKLKKTLTFFWTDFYHKGEQIANTHEDLREVLKAGQDITFDCFEILDDNGGLWNKIIMAWVDGKPKIKEITPEEFIKENQLVVSATEVLVESDEPSNDETEQQKPTVPPRKFLTVVDDDSDESSDSELLEAAVFQPPKAAAHESLPRKPELVMESSDDDDKVNSLSDLTQAVGKMISSFKNSEADEEMIASDIINLILSGYVEKNSLNKVEKNSDNDLETKTPTGGSTEDSTKSVSVTDASVQTILTGDVISLSVFTMGMANLK